MKLLRMKPGHGEILLAEGDPEVAAEERELIAAFRAQLDQGLWAAVPTATGTRPAPSVRGLTPSHHTRQPVAGLTVVSGTSRSPGRASG